MNTKKANRRISINKELDNLMNEIISNKSKYIEYLIYNDLNEKYKDDRIKKIKL
jgi:hypothetical protein